MKKIILLATIALALFSCKKKDEPVTPPVVDPFAGKECVTMDATNVTQVSATINGYFLPNDNKESTQNYFYFLISQNKDILNADEIIKKENDDVWIIGPETEEEMIPDQNHQVHYNCTGVLTPGTTYYIRALIYSVKEAEEGEEGKEDFIHADNIISFTTKSFDAGKTKVTTQDVTNAGPFKATLSATLTSDAGADIVRRGGWFLYGPAGSTLEELKASGTKVAAEFSEDGTSFNADITDLQFSTTYSYVACAFLIDENSVYYGEVKRFTTADFNLQVTTLEASAGPIKATLNGSFSPSLEGNSSVEAWFLVGPQGFTLETLKADGIKVNATMDGQSFSAVTPILSINTPYCFVGAAKTAGKEAYGEIKNFSTTPREVPEGAVEMGLSVLWSTRNVGAETEADYGDFYAWGEVETKDNYSQETYKWYDASSDYQYFKYYYYVDKKVILDPEDDAATAHWGAPWRMATRAEWQELIDYCDWTLTERDGKPGYEIKSRLTGNSIFLISIYTRHWTNTYLNTNALAYFTSEKDLNSSFTCYTFYFNTSSQETPYIGNGFRYQGSNIRAVRE